MNAVYVLIVNWNGWQDTLECLESVFRSDYPSYRVVVCDNGSTDGSAERIVAWADGNLDVFVPRGNTLRRLSHPPVPKPVSRVEYDRETAEGGGSPGNREARLVLVRTGANLGFAGGNNVGLRYALARDDFDYVWLLNNDTVVEPDALRRLAERMQESKGAGMCGSTLPCYDRPGAIWSRGGAIYNKWTMHSRGIDHLGIVAGDIDPREVERRMDYVAGASMLVSRPFLKEIGLMCEDYFLYYEEPDWAARARHRFGMAYARASVVYHKVGASTAAIGKDLEGVRALRQIRYRNAILFGRKHYPWTIPTVWLSIQIQKIISWTKDRLGLRKHEQWK